MLGLRREAPADTIDVSFRVQGLFLNGPALVLLKKLVIPARCVVLCLALHCLISFTLSDPLEKEPWCCDLIWRCRVGARRGVGYRCACTRHLLP